MLGWALTYLVAALFAAAVGFGGISGLPAIVAQVLFVFFLLLSGATVVRRMAKGKPPI